MATKQTDTVAMTEEQLDAVAGGIILNNDGGRGSGRDRFGGQEGEPLSEGPTGQHDRPWWVRPTGRHEEPWWQRVR